MLVSAADDPRRAGTIWLRDLDEPIPAIQPLALATFRRLGIESAPELANAMESEPSAEIIHRFETGRRCYGAWVEGKLAAYGWVSFDKEYVGELSLRLELLPGEAYIWDCVTLPAYRHKHLFSALLAYIAGDLRFGPFCRTWIGANQENLASQRGIARAGFHCVADLVVERVLALRLVWVHGRPAAPAHQVAEARRVFLHDRDAVWLSALTHAMRS